MQMRQEKFSTLKRTKTELFIGHRSGTVGCQSQAHGFLGLGERQNDMLRIKKYDLGVARSQ